MKKSITMGIAALFVATAAPAQAKDYDLTEQFAQCMASMWTFDVAQGHNGKRLNQHATICADEIGLNDKNWSNIDWDEFHRMYKCEIFPCPDPIK